MTIVSVQAASCVLMKQEPLRSTLVTGREHISNEGRILTIMTVKGITILYYRLAFAVNTSNVQRQEQLNDSVCIYSI